MSTTGRLSTENESGLKGPADTGPLLFFGQTMVPEADDVYFDVPGVASVRWDADGQLVLVEWRGWANAAEIGSPHACPPTTRSNPRPTSTSPQHPLPKNHHPLD